MFLNIKKNKKDKEQIIDLTILYASAIDDSNWILFDQIFADDATALIFEKYIIGKNNIKNHIEKSVGLLYSQHMISNHKISINKIDAICECYFQAYHFKEKKHDSPYHLLLGKYKDSLSKIDNTWKITHRELIPLWSSGQRMIIPQKIIKIPDALK